MADPLADAETLRIDDDGHLVRARPEADELRRHRGAVHGPRSLVRADVRAGLVRRGTTRSTRTATYEGRDRDHMFMTAFLQHLIDDGMPVDAVGVDGGWLEVDTLDDLDAYEALHGARRARRDSWTLEEVA